MITPSCICQTTNTRASAQLNHLMGTTALNMGLLGYTPGILPEAPWLGFSTFRARRRHISVLEHPAGTSHLDIRISCCACICAGELARSCIEEWAFPHQGTQGQKLKGIAMCALA